VRSGVTLPGADAGGRATLDLPDLAAVARTVIG